MTLLPRLLRPAAQTARSAREWDVERAVKRARVRALLCEIAEPAAKLA